MRETLSRFGYRLSVVGYWVNPSFGYQISEESAAFGKWGNALAYLLSGIGCRLLGRELGAGAKRQRSRRRAASIYARLRRDDMA